MHTVAFVLILLGLGIIASVYTGLCLLLAVKLPRIVLRFVFVPVQLYVYASFVAFLVYVTKKTVSSPKAWEIGYWIVALLVALVPALLLLIETGKSAASHKIGRLPVKPIHAAPALPALVFGILFFLPLATLGDIWVWMEDGATPITAFQRTIPSPTFASELPFEASSPSPSLALSTPSSMRSNAPSFDEVSSEPPVWVTDGGTFLELGQRGYGTANFGEFMSKSEAIASGYRRARRGR